MEVGDIKSDWFEEGKELGEVGPSWDGEGKAPGWDDDHYWSRLEVSKEERKVVRERKEVKVRKEVRVRKEVTNKTYPHLMPICSYMAMKLREEGYKKLLKEENARTEEQLEEKLMARIKRELGVCRNPEDEKFRSPDFDVEKMDEDALKKQIRGWERGLKIVEVDNGGKARHFVVLHALGPNYFDSQQPRVRKEESKESTGEGQLRGVEQEVIKSFKLISFK